MFADESDSWFECDGDQACVTVASIGTRQSGEPDLLESRRVPVVDSRAQGFLVKVWKFGATALCASMFLPDDPIAPALPSLKAPSPRPHGFFAVVAH